MNPSFLISAALLFWGGQTGLIPLALVLALVLEAHRLVREKWDIAPSNWNHVADLCTILLLSVLIYSLMADKEQTIYIVGKSLPAILFPFIATQRYSVAGRVELSALSLIARRKHKQPSTQRKTIDVTYPYFLATLLAAGMGNVADTSYYGGIVVLGLWALLPFRSRAFSLPLWLTLLALTILLGHYGYIGLYRLQEKVLELSQRLYDQDINPLKTTTSIGDIGKQKLSNRIVFRARLDQGKGPILLREACYNTFRSPHWFAIDSNPQPAYPILQNGKWTLNVGQKTLPEHWIQIQAQLKKGQYNLKLPNGAFAIENLSDNSVQINTLGSITIDLQQSKLANYRVLFSASSTDPPPRPRDLDIPYIEYDAVMRIVRQLQLRGKNPERIAAELHTYFNTAFSYSLDLEGKGRRNTPLEHFLLDRKAGHCEYFATATVLILRACNIPARYAIGYVATEYSPLENQLIVRKRHAHAWARAYINGRWVDLDTTSPNWLNMENDAQSPFHILSDFGAFLSFKFSQFRWSEKHYMEKTAAGLMLILALLMAFRLRNQKQNRRARVASKKVRKRKKGDAVSEFDRLELLLTRKGYPRNPGEPLTHWALRMQQAAPELLDYDDLLEIIHCHYHARFSLRTDQQRETASYNTLIHDLTKKLKQSRPTNGKSPFRLP